MRWDEGFSENKLLLLSLLIHVKYTNYDILAYMYKRIMRCKKTTTIVITKQISPNKNSMKKNKNKVMGCFQNWWKRNNEECWFSIDILNQKSQPIIVCGSLVWEALKWSNNKFNVYQKTMKVWQLSFLIIIIILILNNSNNDISIANIGIIVV